MEKTPVPNRSFKDFMQWATTPPQAYGMYFICLILVGGLSFYAGYLRPKKPGAFAPRR
jgi:hypothetical protein